MNNVVTRGLSLDSSFLITRGFDVVEVSPIKPSVGGKVSKQKYYKKYIELFIDIKGTKCFVVKLFYNIVGKKQIKVDMQIETVAELLSISNAYYTVQDTESLLVENSVEIFGQSLHELLLELQCLGIEASELELLYGIKGIKSFVIDKTAFLNGIKKIILNKENKIKGKRDISAILSSLGMLDEEDN